MASIVLQGENDNGLNAAWFAASNESPTATSAPSSKFAVNKKCDILRPIHTKRQRQRQRNATLSVHKLITFTCGWHWWQDSHADADTDANKNQTLLDFSQWTLPLRWRWCWRLAWMGL